MRSGLRNFSPCEKITSNTLKTRLLIRPHLCGFVRILGPVSAHIFRKSEKIRIFENFLNLDSLIKSVSFCINISHNSVFLLTMIRILDRSLMTRYLKLHISLSKFQVFLSIISGSGGILKTRAPPAAKETKASSISTDLDFYFQFVK